MCTYGCQAKTPNLVQPLVFGPPRVGPLPSLPPPVRYRSNHGSSSRQYGYDLGVCPTVIQKSYENGWLATRTPAEVQTSYIRGDLSPFSKANMDPYIRGDLSREIFR